MGRIDLLEAWQKGNQYKLVRTRRFQSWVDRKSRASIKPVITAHLNGLKNGSENVDAKELTTPKGESRLWELRIRRPELRVYFSDIDANTLVVLLVGDKDSQERDIKSALRLLKTIMEEGVITRKRVGGKERDIAKERYAVPVVPVYPLIIEEWLENEKDRKVFLDTTFDEDFDMEHAKLTVRKSRVNHDDPVPVPEFFGY